MKKEGRNILKESTEDYGSAFADGELQLLKEGLARSYKERFEFATRLYKINQTMGRASISHKPFKKK